MFENDTPININEYSVDEVWKLVEDPADYRGLSPRVRLNYVKMLYDVIGLDLTPDVALATISMDTYSLILATAGSGKTTSTQLKVLLYKLILQSKFRPSRKMMGKEILCLVYNRHNVPDIEDKHENLVGKLKLAKIKGLDIDNVVRARTMHSFCEFWKKKYLAKLGLVGFTLMSDEEAIVAMDRAVRLAFRMKKIPLTEEVSVKNMLNLYNLCRESLRSVKDLQGTDKFEDLNMSVKMIELCFERFEATKRLKKRYDYCDLLVSLYNLLKSDDKVKATIQTYYSAIIADEVQDFTPIMWKILKLMTDNGTRLTCIGDEDQCIYQFRGADIYDLLKFKENFPGGKVYTLSYNRRCCRTILNEASAVVEQNSLRFDKQFKGVKNGGSIITIPYNTVEGQFINLTEKLRELSQMELEKSVVCFRENENAFLLADLLEEYKIPFHSLQGTLPFSHDIYRHFISVLNALEMPFDKEVIINLYKVLPCTKSQMYKVLGYDTEKRRFVDNNGNAKQHFGQYDYGYLTSVHGFTETLTRLIEISTKVRDRNVSMNQYVPELFSLFKKYFWDFVKSKKDNYSCNDLFEERAKKFFYSEKSWTLFFEGYSRKLSVCRSNNNNKAGITISTFHGLKGLEFENVFVIFMDDNIFPNFSLIESKQYSSEVKKDLKEAETRLWYVVITRAINKLIIFYAKESPSSYVDDYLLRQKICSSESGIIEEQKSMNLFNNVLEEEEEEEDFVPVQRVKSIATIDFSNKVTKSKGDFLSNLIASL